jgi:hypothetical protein
VGDPADETVRPPRGLPPMPARDEAGEELVGYLERDQLEEAMETRLPPAELSRWSRAGLWALRVFVVAVGAMVVYTFIAGLH